MKKKIFLFPAVIVSVCLITSSCSLAAVRGVGGDIPGSGNIVTETREPGAFSSISIEYPGAVVTIRQGNRETVELEADDNLLPQLSTEVVSGTLTIKNVETNWKTTVNPSKPVNLTITVKDLTAIILSAPVGDLRVNDLQADTFQLVVSGGAQVRLNGIQVHLLDGVLSGAGDIQASGTADEIKLVLSGLGNFNAADLQSKRADIELSGMGGATVRVEEELAATITGAGSIQYYGHPHMEQSVNGAGSVKPAE
jgi:predicted small secreted protein